MILAYEWCDYNTIHPIIANPTLNTTLSADDVIALPAATGTIETTGETQGAEAVSLAWPA